MTPSSGQWVRSWTAGVLLLSAPAAGLGQAADMALPGHLLGDASAPVEIVEFGDYSCTFCAQFERTTMPSVRTEWIEQGRASYRFVPFHKSYFREGRNAARAAQCAARQHAFWPMHELIYARQDEWLGRRGQRERLRSWAMELGLDGEAFDACWDEDPGERLLERNTNLAHSRGVRGTPAFFINGRPAVGALSYRDFRVLLAQAATGGGLPRR